MAEPSSNGPKAFASVIALVAVIAGIYAMVEPMSQRVDFLERQLTETRQAMMLDDQRESSDRNLLAAFQERFSEIETQFRAMKELEHVQLQELRRRIERLEVRGGD